VRAEHGSDPTAICTTTDNGASRTPSVARSALPAPSCGSTNRLAVVFTVGLPLVLLVWAALHGGGRMVRLMTLYWKVASLLCDHGCLLLVDARPLGLRRSAAGPAADGGLQSGSGWISTSEPRRPAALAPLR